MARDRRNPATPPADNDLLVDVLPELTWGGAQTRASLERLFRLAEARARRTHQWYLNEKRAKARYSRRCRAMAIVFTALGGLVPLVAGVDDRIPEQWGFVFLAVAAAFVGADRFFGFSSAWMRYMLSAVNVEEQLYRFQYEWAQLSARGEGDEPDGEQVEAQLACIKRFSSCVMREVRIETEAWVLEFKSNVAQLESMSRRADERAATPPPVDPAERASAGDAVAAEDETPPRRRRPRDRPGVPPRRPE